jgi:hypothetical protein
LIRSDLARALLISQGLALLWWLVALWFQSNSPTPIWYDQQTTFLSAAGNIVDPYVGKAFVVPPWAALLLVPFSVFPLPAAVLLQLCVYFALLTAVIFKFGGNLRTVLIALTCFLALDSGLELNIDWMVCIGLLVSPVLSGVFILIKPQVALGYWLSFTRREFIRASIVALLVLLGSFLLWGSWPLRILEKVREFDHLHQSHNVAPMTLMSVPVSLAVGLALAWYGFRKRDPIICLLSGLFFIPYVQFYSLLPPFALFAVRYPRVAILGSVIMWLIIGGVLGLYFFTVRRG